MANAGHLDILKLLALAVAGCSLLWGVMWAIWNYQRLHKPRLLVFPRPAILFGSKGLKFRPKGAKKSIPIPPNELQQWCVGIRVDNIGPSLVTIDHLEAYVHQPQKRLRDRLLQRRKQITLQGCWIAIQQDEHLPKVLKPGEAWEGLCDYFWLKDTLQKGLHQPGPPWLLRVRVVDTLSRRYEGMGPITERGFTSIAEEHRDAEEEE